MGTKLSDYMENEGRPKTGRSAVRREVYARAYTLAADLIELRQRLGMTQQELAARSGVAQSEISRIERGVVHPTDTTWARLAAAVDADVRLVPMAKTGRATTSRTVPAN
jgi:DNA-binding XRE family transcriptional regulator